jgi:hypothetical protein
VLYPVVVAIQPTILSHQLEAEKTLTKQNLEMDTSISCFETLNDLNQIMNATAETVEMKRPKKHGHHYCITF